MNGMRKIIIAVVMLAGLTLFGCGGGSSSSTAAADTASDAGTVLVKTTLDLTGTRAISGKAAVAATVTITAADGTVYTMTPTGVTDEYECRIAYTNGDPLYIKAQIGNVELRNFISSLSSTTGDVDLGSTTPATTLFVDVLQSMAQEVDASITDNVSFVSALLSGVKQGTFAVDVETVKTQVLDNASSSPVISQLMTQYQSQMTWVNAGSSDNMVIQNLGQMVSQVASTIHSSGMMIPASANVAEELATLAESINADNSKVLNMIYPEGFIMYGATAESFISNISSSNSDDPWAGLTVKYLKNTATAEPVSVDSDVYKALSKDGTEIYRVYFSDHKQGLDANGVIRHEHAYDDIKAQDSGIILQKINGVWYFRGNQEKAEIDFDYMQFASNANNGTGLHIGVRGADYPITSATVTSDVFSGSIDLYHRADGDFVLELYTITGQLAVVNGSTQTPVTLTDSTLAGHKFTVTVNYQDGTSETYVKTVPVADTSINPSVSAQEQTDGSVKVSYVVPVSHSTSDVLIMLQNNGGDEIRGEDLPFESGSYTFTGLNLQKGQQYTFELAYYTLDGVSYRRDVTITY